MASDHAGWKRPRTTQEKRMSIRDIGFIRAKRNINNLPEHWDDRSTDMSRSWKKYRTTQYRID